MAGRGPAPKAPNERRNHMAPQRGEWMDLPVPSGDWPDLPERMNPWSERTTRAWQAWWCDPASTQWGVGDVDLLEHLADVFEEWTRERRVNLASEVRQLRDSLGLTPKGKQERRWKVVPAGEIVEFVEEKSAAERMEELRKRASSAGRAS
jgi:hypothetical protein